MLQLGPKVPFEKRRVFAEKGRNIISYRNYCFKIEGFAGNGKLVPTIFQYQDYSQNCVEVAKIAYQIKA